MTKHHSFLCDIFFPLHLEQCVVIRVDLQNSTVALIESQNWSLITFPPRGRKTTVMFSQGKKKMSCVNRRSTGACYQLKETFPFKWGATELPRLFEEMCLAQTRAAASPVFLTAETSLTPDGWSNTSHLSLNPPGGSSLYSSLQIDLQTTLLGHPSTQYLLMARSPDWMHCVCKGKYICWFCSICTLTANLSVLQI